MSRSSKRCKCKQSIGAQLGDMAQTGLTGLAKGFAKSWFGVGDYSLKTNSLIQTGGATTSDVQIVPQGNREIRIIYREYLGDVYTHPTTAGAFSIASFAINPGLVSTCPWLAPIAQQYEQWTPNGIVFEFKSTSSEYVATQALGSVIMATEYDVLDAAFVNKQEMLNSAYSNEAKPSQRIVHGVECDPRDNPLRIFYVRAGAVSSSQLRDYDVGTFYIATQGGATANLNLGSLYIHYDLTFRKEQIFGGIPMRGELTYFAYLNGPVNGTAVLGSSTPVQTAGNFTPTIVTNTITFPTYTVGAVWEIIYTVIGTSAALTLTNTYTLSNMTDVTEPNFSTSSSSTWWPITGATSSRALAMTQVRQDAASASYTFATGNTLPTNPTYASLAIKQISASFRTLAV